MKTLDASVKNLEIDSKHADHTYGISGQDLGDEAVFEFGRFTLDIKRRRLCSGGEVVPLSAKPFDVLAILVQERHRVVDKHELLRRVWSDTFVADESLAQAISVLRKSLGDTSHQSEFILTFPRSGYRFIANVQVVDTAGSTGMVDHPDGRLGATRWRLSRLKLVIIGAAALTVLGIAASSLMLVGKARDEVSPVVFDVRPPQDHTLESGAVLSPDGRHLAFVTRDSSGQCLVAIRSFSSLETRIIEGTEGAANPFWSPDSRFLAFFADGKLKKVSLAGGHPQALTNIPEHGLYGGRTAGGAWSSAGLILFAPNMFAGLYQVPASGGLATVLLAKDDSRRDGGYRWPAFLPDGRHFLFELTNADPGRAGVYVGDVEGSQASRLVSVRSKPLYSPSGYLLFGQRGTLMAEPFDPKRAQLSGPPVRVADQIAWFFDEDNIAASVADNGTLAYVAGEGPSKRLAWYDRTGRPLEWIRASEDLSEPSLSPDQTRVAATRRDPVTARLQVWLLEMERGLPSPLILGSSSIAHALWSPDGRDLAFTVDSDVYRRPVTAAGSGQLLVKDSQPKYALDDWSSDGRFLIYTANSPSSALDLWLVPLFGDRKPLPLIRTPYNEYGGQISPDGRWLAYASDESGSFEVYVQSFSAGEAKRRVSMAGGTEPRWRRDGSELFYLDSSQRLVAVSIRSESSLEIKGAVSLFQTHVTGPWNSHYRVSNDGQRFLIDSASEPARAAVTVTLNWTAAFGR